MTENNNDTIKDLPQLLANFIGSKSKVIGTTISRLTAPNENFGSIMLKVDVHLKNEENKDEETILCTVAKLIPPLESMQAIFSIQETYKNEVAFYRVIVPTLVNFQQEHGIVDVLDCFAQYYGSRLNLNRTDVVDKNAVLLLENLKASGYDNINRHDGFDLETTKFILKDCARLHATVIALKLENGSLFEKNIRPYCRNFVAQKHHAIGLHEMTKAILKENPMCAPLVHKLKYWCEKDHERKINEPFATLTHCDMWVNNLMQKFENGKVVGNKFVDFQTFTYRSPAVDLFFLLWTSVNHALLKQKLDFFIQYYHEKFIDTLQELKCDTTPFSYQNLLNEMRIEAEHEFAHAITFKIFVVNGRKNSEFDGKLDEATRDKYIQLVDHEVKEQAWDMVLECEKRGWFY